MTINQATDWQNASITLRKQLSNIGYNPDLQKMYKNIETMVSELSKLEVDSRRTNNHTKINEKLSSVNNAIQHLEKLIIMAQLMR